MSDPGARLKDEAGRRRRLRELSEIRKMRELEHAGEIVGRIRRRRNGRYIEAHEAEELARQMPWWRPGLLRCGDQRYYVWRERVV